MGEKAGKSRTATWWVRVAHRFVLSVADDFAWSTHTLKYIATYVLLGHSKDVPSYALFHPQDSGKGSVRSNRVKTRVSD